MATTTRKDLRQRIGSVGYCADMLGDSVYERHRIFSILDKNNAINEAMRLSGLRWARRVEDTSLTLAATTFTYALANLTVTVDRFRGLDEVLYNTGATGTGPPYQALSKDFWYVRDANATLTLQLTYLPVTTGTLRLVYRVAPSAFTADSSTGGTLDPDDVNFADYICLKATALLFDKQAIRDEKNRNYWAGQAQMFHQRADAISYQVDEGIKGQAQDDVERLNARIEQATKGQKK